MIKSVNKGKVNGNCYGMHGSGLKGQGELVSGLIPGVPILLLDSL